MVASAVAAANALGALREVSPEAAALDGGESASVGLAPDERANLAGLSHAEQVTVGRQAGRLRDVLDAMASAEHASVRLQHYNVDVWVVRSDDVARRFSHTNTRMSAHAWASGPAGRQRGVSAWASDRPLSALGEDDAAAWRDAGARAVDQARRLAHAPPPRTGEQSVVFGPGAAGVLVHEIFGHSLEADVVARGESALAKRRGSLVGSPALCVVDGRRTATWGSAQFDDEGAPSQRTVLVGDGVVEGVLSDRHYGAKLGADASTGNGRRSSYAHAPLPRSTVTWIEEGAEEAAGILAGTRDGLYVSAVGGGNADPARDQFTFVVQEGAEIVNGQLGPTVRDARLVGSITQTVGRIDAIADDLRFESGLCGKGGQWLPVSFGAPTLRIDQVAIA